MAGDEATAGPPALEGQLVRPDAPMHALSVRQAQVAQEHPAAVYLARLAPKSQRVMAYALRRLAGFLSGDLLDAQTLDWAQLRYAHVAALRARIQTQFSPATTNLMLAALKGVLREAWRLGHMDAEAYHRTVDVALVKSHTLPSGRALLAGEMRALFLRCSEDETPAGVRDAALLTVLYGVGVRRSESVNLDVLDWDGERRTLKVRRGKGAKDRLAHLPEGGVAPLLAWLLLRGAEPGPLFIPVQKNGVLVLRRMTDQAVLYILRKRAAQATVAAFTPHDLRRTFISDLLDAGADIATVQNLAGHANVQTTARYDRRGEATRRKAADLLHIPYVLNQQRKGRGGVSKEG